MEVEEISSGDLKLQLQRLTSELEDKNSIIQQLNDENNLLKQSKSDIADHYIEKLFPNVAGLCQLFNSNVSVNQLYSMYIQERRLNGDLKLKVDNSKVEQNVITERLSLLNNELDAARETIQQLSSEILELKKLEEKVFQVENDNKETNIALRFYQDSALSLYKGLKEFKEIFLALSVKIQHLAHPSSGESTTNNTEDATGIKTLKYILELQTKFQDFNRLQTEFEKGKLDLVSMKKNFIDTDHEIEALRNQVSFLESEKRISTKQYDLLHSEYVTLANLLNHLKASNENKVNHLQSINGQLQAQVQKLTQTVEQLKCDHNKFVESKAKERQELEAKLLVCEKDLESANKKVISQKGFLSQMETSLDSFRKQNKNLNEINSKLTGNINGQLSSRENEICQLTQKLQAEEERNKKLEAEIRDINSKYASQSGQMESLQQELANFKNSSTQRHQMEINNLKSSLAKSNELKVNQGKEILTLKSEIARVQSTNQQLKALARKYKTQYEEQKQVTNTLSVSGDDQKENSTELTNQIIAKDERISALEEKLASTLSELGAAKQEVINASSANAELQSQYNETDQRAKKIASSAQQRIIELKRILAEKNSEIAALRTERQTDDMYLINQPSTSKASFTLLSSSSKMPISSTSISSRSSTVPSSSFESAISSNINQPSSSNEENFNLDSLQSTQITSHSTSDDNSSELFSSIVADSNVSSNKRGYSSDSDPGHLGRKNRRNETDEVTTYEDESSNQSAIVNIEEDSNDGSAAVPTDAASAAVAAVSAPGSSSANYTSSNGESVESADNDTQMDSQMEEPNAIDQMNSPDDQPDEQEQQQEQQSFAQEQQQQQSPNSASSSQLFSRPSSIDRGHLLTSSTSSSSVDSALGQPGTSTMFTQSSIVSNDIAFHSMSGHLFSGQPITSNLPEHEQNQQPEAGFGYHGAPRLIIPPNSSSNLLSPQNSLMMPMASFLHEESEGIVPSTPIMYAPRTPFEEHSYPHQHPHHHYHHHQMTSPQVQQPLFLFNNSTAASSSNSQAAVSVTPSISETVSSVISIDEAVGDYESPNQSPRANVSAQEEEEEEEEQISLPTSSDSTAGTSSQPQSVSSGTASRVRKLRIRGLRGGRNQ